ncbi:hypothetical protein DY218_28630 [Streptomyces triticagri]|uniref:Uncharacterized protein n=1 Tax=Streptomyces triticagri TaxID=2293568 RepID=A0A372LYB7_9ACTN|nr:hypothetical protein [Streptomyces triticagri]RFU83275.1 hypothetical protein DY218_28630 [Streptomyces triticagri]
MRPATRRRVLPHLIRTLSLALAIGTGMRLRSYGVPPLQAASSVLGIWWAGLWLALRLEDALSVVTHRCTAPGCHYVARVHSPDPGTNRRWQEIAAAHPTHSTI